jgi:predicted aminopeptidase
MVSEEKNFKNQPFRNKNHLWWPCLLTGRDEMSNLYRGPSIDASYQVSVHLAKGFQRRRLKYEKLTDDRRMPKAHISFGKVS